MTKLIKNLREAKRSHKRWVGLAKELIEGLPIQSQQVPQGCLDCEFGKWYYGCAKKMIIFDEYKAIEAPHTELHAIYLEIFDQLFTVKKQSFFKKIFGETSKVSVAEKVSAQNKVKQLQNISDIIVNKMDALENRIQNMNVNEFAILY